jgi:tRNA pseudouridine55 synthase
VRVNDSSLVRLVHKPRRVTPVEAIERLREIDPSLRARRIGYAGRLDPLAEGLLVLLLDEENKRAEAYNHLEKQYEIEVLLGARSDTFDLLGLAEVPESPGHDDNDNDAIPRAIASLEGTRSQPYPPYSAVRIQGRPAFYWARRGVVPEGGWPERARTVHRATLTGRAVLSGDSLVDRAIDDVRAVRGDFRQDALCARWSALRPTLSARALTVLSLHVHCSSGTFMRSLAHSLGEQLSTFALALSIRRTQVGPYSLRDAIAV